MVKNEMQSYSTIQLERGSTGLGFNIRGGFDQPLLPNDDGIFVTKIRDSGSAAQDGRLKEGDKIIEINGQSLLGVKHATAVEIFVSAGEEVELLVWHGAEKYLVDEYTEKQRQSRGMRPATKTLLLVGVITFVTIAVYYWRTNRGFKL